MQAMKRLRSFATAAWLALALIVGQQAAALHALEHARAELAQKHESLPDAPACEEHFLFAGFSGALASNIPELPPVALGEAAPAVQDERAAPQALRLAFRSRAPPASLV